jgi:DNA-binding NarL/FixJ family response regulator
MTVDTIRVVLADDHAVVRTGLKAVLRTAPDVEVVGEASNGREAIALVERLRPDVLITDLAMPDVDGAEVTKEVIARGLPCRILVLTMHVEEEYLVPLLEAGASGYLVKSAADRELLAAVRSVAHGDTYVQPAAGQVLARQLTRKDPAKVERERYEQLTQRERDVVRLVAQGFSGPEIGEQLGISPKTVDTYKQRIEQKLGLAHRTAYVQFALKLGILGEQTKA